MNKKELGAFGEAIVKKILKSQGMTVLDENFTCKLGEIDLIAKEKDVLVFIEVKTRKSDKFGEPEESVNIYKQKKLRTLASYYLAGLQKEYRCRFDVYSVILDHNYTVKKVKVFRDCF